MYFYKQKGNSRQAKKNQNQFNKKKIDPPFSTYLPPTTLHHRHPTTITTNLPSRAALVWLETEEQDCHRRQLLVSYPVWSPV
jgi:hypothetical protein